VVKPKSPQKTMHLSQEKTVWSVSIGEPLSFHFGRKHRADAISDELQGYKVIHFRSKYNHLERKHYSNEICGRLKNYFFLYAWPSYTSNIGVSRIIFNWITAFAFYFKSISIPPPSAIIFAYPIPEVAWLYLMLARQSKTKIVIDLRDIWPDSWSWATSFSKKSFGHRILLGLSIKIYRGMLLKILREADSVVSISYEYLKWAKQYESSLSNTFVKPLLNKKYKENLGTGVCSEAFLSTFNDLLKRGAKIIWTPATLSLSIDEGVVKRILVELEKKSDIIFVVSGAGEKNSVFEDLAKKFRNLIFTGWLGENEFGFLGEKCCCIFIPIQQGAPQSVSNKVLLGREFRKPVIITRLLDTDDLEKILGDSVYCVNPCKTTEVVDKILEVAGEKANLKLYTYPEWVFSSWNDIICD
jgi:hypothetical protein